MILNEILKYHKEVEWSHEVRLNSQTIDFRNPENPHVLLPGLYLEQNSFGLDYWNFGRSITPCTWAWLAEPIDTRIWPNLDCVRVVNVGSKRNRETQLWLWWCIEMFGEWRVRWDEVKKLMNRKSEVTV
jgi:hemolysin-activating ACP:hemolysin acyltransferase